MVRKNIHKNLIKQVSTKYPNITGAELEEISKVVEKEALRKGKKGKKSIKRNNKYDGCDA